VVTFATVAPPAAPAQTQLNLLASAEAPSPSGDDWMGGFVWLGESCPDWQGFAPCAELTESPPPGTTELAYVVPVGYRTMFACSTLSGMMDGDRQRAQRQAERIASFVAARELWTGELSQLDPYDLPNGGAAGQVNPHLAGVEAGSTLTATGDIMTAVADLEATVAEATLGGPVFLHGSTRLLGRVAQNFERVGNELRTKTGAVVIPDAGYPGTGPDGTGEDWLYGTGPVVVRLGPVTTDLADASTIDRPINLRQVIAQRMFAVGFDPCTLFAIHVTG
jgi:hypothetical protein